MKTSSIGASSIRSLIKTTLLGCLLTGSHAYAQYTTYLLGQDHIYSSVVKMTPSGASGAVAGYAIANTVVDPGFAGTRGEIVRTDLSGNQVWSKQYNIHNKDRFTSIETYQFSKNINYFVVGSTLDISNDHILAMCVDDNGNVIRSVQIPPREHPNVIATRGIPTSDSGFVIVGVAAQDYNSSDKKAIVLIKLDSLLNIEYYYTYDSPDMLNDYDMAANVVEGVDSNEFLMIGTANNPSSGSPVTMAALIDMPTGNVTWHRYYYTTGSVDVGADALFNPADSTFWLMGNGASTQCFHLRKLDHNGNQIDFQEYNAPGGNVLGFELKKSLNDPNYLVVGGWRYDPSGAVAATLVEIDPITPAVVWDKTYAGLPGSTTAAYNQMQTFVENNWLQPLAASFIFPYYYNSVMTYNANNSGYTILTSDTLGATVESVQMWSSMDLQGTVLCGHNPPNVYYSGNSYTDAEFPMEKHEHVGPSTSCFVSEIDYTYSEQKCEPLRKMANAVQKVETEALALTLYPNPANTHIMVKAPAENISVAAIVITDVAGKTLNRIAMPYFEQDIYNVNIALLPSGNYILKVIADGGREYTSKFVKAAQ